VFVSQVLSESSRPYCNCPAGRLGTACEIRELPSLKLTPFPLTNDGKLFSGKSTRLSVLLHTNKTSLDDITPFISSIVIKINEPTLSEPFVKAGIQTNYVFPPGEALITAEVTFLNNPDLVSITLPLQAVDCTCSARGQCDVRGQCICDDSAFGAACQYGMVSGVLTVPLKSQSVSSLTSAYLPFSTPLLGNPLSVNVTLFDRNQVQADISVAYATRFGVSVLISRSDTSSVTGWSDKIRLLYRASGLRYVAPSQGKILLNAPAAASRPPVPFTVTFPVPYHEPPFVTVKVDSSSLPSTLFERYRNTFEFTVQTVSAGSATFRVFQSQNPGLLWNYSIPIMWTAQPYPTSEIRQMGIFSVGPRAVGPVIVSIPFSSGIYRFVPNAVVNLYESNLDEVLQLQVMNVRQDGMDVRIVRFTETQDLRSGWTQNLQLAWTATPSSYDAVQVPKVTIANASNAVDFNLGDQALQLSRAAGAFDCALACAATPNCRSFVFSPLTMNGVSVPTACQVSMPPGQCVLKGVPLLSYSTSLISDNCTQIGELDRIASHFPPGQIFRIPSRVVRSTDATALSSIYSNNSICHDSALLLGLSVSFDKQTKQSLECVYPPFGVRTDVVFGDVGTPTMLTMASFGLLEFAAKSTPTNEDNAGLIDEEAARQEKTPSPLAAQKMQGWQSKCPPKSVMNGLSRTESNNLIALCHSLEAGSLGNITQVFRRVSIRDVCLLYLEPPPAPCLTRAYLYFICVSTYFFFHRSSVSDEFISFFLSVLVQSSFTSFVLPFSECHPRRSHKSSIQGTRCPKKHYVVGIQLISPFSSDCTDPGVMLQCAPFVV
jgi:hypothetical protein